MNKIIKFGFMLLCVCLVSGCATTANYQRILNNWQGAKMSDLINTWGYPDAAVRLPNGDLVYMYTRQRFYTTPTTPMMTPTIINVSGTPMYATTYNGMVMGGQSYILSCRTWFEVNRQGVIVNTQFQGNNCIASNSSSLKP
jgi:hypothetical protein